MKKTGIVYLKVVNTMGKKQSITINLKGAAKVSPNATLIVVKGQKPEDTNSITDPEKIAPVTSTVNGIKPVFTRTLDPYSVNILQIQTGQ